MKKFLENLYTKAVVYNHKNIFGLFETNPSAKFLDLGCDDGMVAQKVAQHIGTKNIFGVEILPESAKKAMENGVQVKSFDLNGHFDFEENTFDCIHSNQVIEHLFNSDNFLEEIHRILKPGGYAVISTENASSWCNIAASILGWQIFSLTNFSNKKQGIGNPFALHKGSPGAGSWNHVRIYNIRGLKEYFEAYGFFVEGIHGAGYFPFPASFGDIDKIHCHFMTFKIRKI